MSLSHSLLAVDPALPQRDRLLDERVMAEYFGIRNCRRLRTKYRVGTSLRVLYEVTDRERSYRIAARATEANTTFWVFPDDRKIKNLSVLNEIPRELRDINGKQWTKSRVVGHAPEKSVTAQCIGANDEILAYAKVYAGDEGQQVFDTYLHLADALSGDVCDLQVPQALVYSEQYRLLLLESVPGVPLIAETSFFRLGKALKKLHGISAPSSLPHCTRFTTESLARTAGTITQARPDVAYQVQRLTDQLVARHEHAPSGAPVFLHGDVHPKNVLQNDERLVLLDFDQAATGVAAIDLGSAVAGFYSDACVGSRNWRESLSLRRALLEGYGRRGNSRASLRWHVAAALLQERALRSVTRIRINSLRKLPEILTAAETVLNGGIGEN